jgi:tRNA (guanine-N7-)-methyltransferase
MTRRKLFRFAHNAQAENVIEKGKPLYSAIKGNWRKSYFNNDHPIVLELACGKGEYTVGLGKNFPEKNYIGIDIKGDRIARGSRQALELGLTNIAFLRTAIQYLDEFFEPGEVDEIWLVHPDPQPRDKDEKKRLSNPFFLAQYAKYIQPGGIFHLKTDNPFLYEYSLESIGNAPGYRILEHTNDLYESDLWAEHHNITTHYEKLFREKGFSICYIKAVVERKEEASL